MNKINQRVLELYKTHNGAILNSLKILDFEQNSDLPPMFYPDFHNEEFLYVGLNPSFNSEMFEKFAPKELAPKEWFSWDCIKNSSNIESAINSVIEFQQNIKHSEKKIPYFKSIENFCNEIAAGLHYNKLYHYDLFQFRLTSQIIAKEAILKMEMKEDFLKKSTENLCLLVRELKPKFIIVANALASSYIKKFILEDQALDNKYGCYFIDETPIFMGSQLTGGATDNFSRERLAWLIRRYLDLTSSFK